MSGLTGLVAEDRRLLRIAGAEARDWLQSLVTNDVAQAGRDRAVYAALLTPQGKYLADFFLLEEGEALLLDVAAGLAPALMKKLALYKVRRKVTIEDASDRLGVALLWGGDAPEPPEGATVAPDPRDARLGWRLYAADPAAALAALDAAPGARAAYDALRVAA